jgi:predicted lipoprotein
VGTQRSLKRRELLTGLVALAQAPACSKRDRAAVLEDLVREVVGAQVSDVLTDSKRLKGDLRALLDVPSADQLRAAQASFRRATVSWKRAASFRAGPFATSQALQRAAFWPARPSAIEAVLAGPGAIDEPRVEALGVDAKGLFALEYLLFREEISARGRATRGGELDARSRAYGFELASNVLGYAHRVKRLFGDGHGYAREFGALGQQGVDELVAQSLDTLDIVLGKLARVERARRNATPLVSAVEGYFSQISLDIVRALLDGTRQLYVGGEAGGLSELVARSSPDIDAHVRQAFALAESGLLALGLPLEVGLAHEPERYRRAVKAVEELKHVMKQEMASALEG